MIAKYGMQETHSIVLIQRPIWSYKQTVQAPMESADGDEEAAYRQNHRKM